MVLLQRDDIGLPTPGLDLWWVTMPPVDVDQWLLTWRSMLGEQDIERLHQRRLPKGQAQFLFTRLVLRNLLSAYHPAVAPAQWQFLKSDTGRPYVAPDQSPLSFNLSHSGDKLLVAVSQYGDPGIDVESVQREVQIQSVAERYFFPSEARHLALLATAPQAQRDWFLRLWTLKESAVKATGLGLSRALRKFEFGEADELTLWHQLHQMPPTDIRFWSGCYQGFVMGVACKAHAGMSIQTLVPVMRELRWPLTTDLTDMPGVVELQWRASQSRNSSTNFEP